MFVAAPAENRMTAAARGDEQDSRSGKENVEIWRASFAGRDDNSAPPDGEQT
jgi:hypothetical protein